MFIWCEANISFQMSGAKSVGRKLKKYFAPITLFRKKKTNLLLVDSLLTIRVPTLETNHVQISRETILEDVFLVSILVLGLPIF